MDTKTRPNLDGKLVKIKEHVKHPQVPNFGGSEYRVEGYWDNKYIGGKSWMDSNRNPACMIYAMRTTNTTPPIPTDDDVLYGKVGSFGHLVHISEIDMDSVK